MKVKNVALFALFALMSFAGFSKTGPSDPQSNYVVIGAFSVEQNAVQFAQLAKQGNLKAEIEINPNRGLFYVYVLHTGDRSVAIEEAKKLQHESPYSDAWVYSGMLGNEQKSNVGVDVNPLSGEVKSTVEPTVIEPVETEKAEPETVITPAEEAVEVPAGSRSVFFKVARASDGELLTSEVNIVDVDKQKKITTLEGNKNVALRPINNKSGNFSVECEVFGYRKVAYLMNTETPETTEGVTVEEGKLVVPFEMVRLRKGDYSIMYNVMFYKDASIMRPEAKYEVSELMEMMKENPKYKIRIHGHTNGKAAGKIISTGEEKNFFSMTGSKEGFGTAKKLSEERANTIKDYLVAEGISADRLQVKAWGGKKPIYEKTHAQAHNNVRVEIEIVEE